jgi:WD40 repeat protein
MQRQNLYETWSKMCSRLVLMPTSSWFTSRPIDICETNGLVASSAINSVIVSSGTFDKYLHTIKDAHTKRVNSLAFHVSKQSGDDLTMLATSSEDLDIKVWNSQTGKLLAQHKLHQVCYYK